ncbi:hypothetical protein LRP30_33925 [Bradyrhizobium sp. C-145]|uniref:hypothetical protein n=1 Tax=Bradyrhizobium sp. C-145 TaxID=574727 RepID=UPI00201B86EC|nr:hypothetical protein [Bradyrhizobium sp. C-145]UQR61761.1 hypothetical protein LRP30_33925 [Bradyrhizobium sp. C-145]
MSNSITFNVTDPVLAMQVAELIARYEGKSTAPKAEQQPTEGNKPLVGITNGRRVEIPHGEQLWHNYLGTDLHATVENGMIRFEDKIYDSPSKAALVAGLTVNKSCNTPNGYKWWNVKRDGKWIPIEKLAE